MIFTPFENVCIIFLWRLKITIRCRVNHHRKKVNNWQWDRNRSQERNITTHLIIFTTKIVRRNNIFDRFIIMSIPILEIEINSGAVGKKS